MERDFVKFDRQNLAITVNLYGGGKLIVGKYDVQISYFSGGPGGQNVNKNHSGVRLIYVIPEKYRMGAFRTREIVTKSINQRKKEQNLISAFGQLADKLRHYFYVKPERKKSNTPKSEKNKRLNSKKFNSRKKESRSAVQYEE